jgi:DNA repair protein RadC
MKSMALSGPFKPGIVLGQDLRTELGLKNCPKILSAASIAQVFSNLTQLKREVMVVGVLDCKCRLIYCELLSIGGTDRLSIRVGDVFTGAVRCGGSAVILAHNHPSDSPTPSMEDLQLTEAVAKAGLLMGYPLLDHVILCASRYRSLLCASSLKRLKNIPLVQAAPLQQAAENNAGEAAWHCHKCMAINQLRRLGPRTNQCIGGHCSECQAFTWINCAL